MTRIELRDALLNRVGWKIDPSFPLAVSSENQESESGRFFQNGHAFVKLATIYELIDEVDTTEERFNEILAELKESVVMLVVDETFTETNIDNIDLTSRDNIFDAAIEKRMSMKIAEILMTTNRKNFIERNGKEYIKNIFFDINGNPNFPDKISISMTYKKELDQLRDLFDSGMMLDSFTMTNNQYHDNERYHFEP